MNQVKKGEEVRLELEIDKLPNGTKLTLPVWVFRSMVNGPCVMLSGGLHGDEVNGNNTSLL